MANFVVYVLLGWARKRLLKHKAIVITCQHCAVVHAENNSNLAESDVAHCSPTSPQKDPLDASDLLKAQRWTHTTLSLCSSLPTDLWWHLTSPGTNTESKSP